MSDLDLSVYHRNGIPIIKIMGQVIISTNPEHITKKHSKQAFYSETVTNSKCHPFTDDICKANFFDFSDNVYYFALDKNYYDEKYYSLATVSYHVINGYRISTPGSLTLMIKYIRKRMIYARY